jgi:hypothetical protein
VSGYECASSIPSPAGTITPPSGDDVCVFSLSLTLTPIERVNLNAQVIPQLAGLVSFGGEHIAISNHTVDYFSTDDFAVAIPAGDRPTLTLSAAGFGQSFSFATGSHVGVAPVVLYRPSSEQLSTTPGEKTTLTETDTRTGGRATAKLTIATVELSYFSPANPLVHAASPNEAFLSIQFAENDVAGPAGDSFQGLQPLPSSAVRLATPTATLYGTPSDELGSGLVAVTYLFTVPGDITEARLELGPAVESAFLVTPAGRSGNVDNVRIGEASVGPPISAPTTTVPPTTTIAPTTTVPASTVPGSVPATTPVASRTSGSSSAVPIAAGAGGGLLVIVVPIVLWRRREKARNSFFVFPRPGTPRRSKGASSARPVVVLAGGDSIVIDAHATSSEPAQPAIDAGAQPASEEPLEVVILGQVRVGGYAKPPGRAAIDEAVVYLSLQDGRPVGSDKMRMVLGDVSLHTLANRIGELRAAIGADRLPRSGKSGYRFVGEIKSDWAEFCRLRDEAAAATGDDRVALLTEALSLVSGIPFSGVPKGRYEWVTEEFRLADFTDPIEDVAREACELLLPAGRERDAEAACVRGLRASPYCKDLHCDRTKAARNDPAGLRRAYTEAVAALGEDEEIVSLYRELSGGETTT